MHIPVFLHGVVTGALILAAIVCGISGLIGGVAYFSVLAGLMVVNGIKNIREPQS